jgi:DNA-binding NtrC family response regulator
LPGEGVRMNARIILFGLDNSLGSELRSVLANQQHAVCCKPFVTPSECLDAVDESGAELIFCSSDPEQYLGLLEVVRRVKPDLPVVVVSHVPEIAEWLDAIEAGAADYCAPPFESSQIRWILDSSLAHHSSAVLYRAAG